VRRALQHGIEGLDDFGVGVVDASITRRASGLSASCEKALMKMTPSSASRRMWAGDLFHAVASGIGVGA
jgi:hypothetical protein